MNGPRDDVARKPRVGKGAAQPDRMAAAVAGLRERPIAVTDKGLGRLAAGGLAFAGSVSGGQVTAASLAAERSSLFDGGFDMPVLVLREAALQQNIESMAAYCTTAGVLHAPHGKTTMAPQLIARQLAAGAWAMSAATIMQVQVYRAFGVSRVLIASELTERGAVEWLGRELAADPSFDCYAYADSLGGVRLLDGALRSVAPGRPLKVLVELGYPGGRTGCRSVGEAVAVAVAVHSAGALELAGAARFEGGIHRDDPPATLAAVAAFCADIRTLGSLLPAPPAGGQRRHVLTAGGSSFFDVACRELSAVRSGHEAFQVVLRSGAYITHDHGHYAATGPGSRAGADGLEFAATPEFVPALELWAAVLSVPEPGLAIVNAGKRDISCDQGMPVPLRIRRPGTGEYEATGMQVMQLDDQHGYLRIPARSELSPGDLVCMGITHPCTTMDKWRVIPVMDDDNCIIDAVHTFF